jgi:hypothetical protein
MGIIAPIPVLGTEYFSVVGRVVLNHLYLESYSVRSISRMSSLAMRRVAAQMLAVAIKAMNRIEKA